MSPSCPLIRRLLSRYMDAELSDRQSAQVERHLTVCPTCQRELDAYVDTARFLAGEEDPEVPRNAWSRLATALQAYGVPGFGQPVALSSPTRGETSPFRMRVLAVAAVVLLAVGLA
ncbi:MAG: anti-sigma factor family protein, partial [Planctomycetota bacterium]